jgi:hypothetical protein
MEVDSRTGVTPLLENLSELVNLKQFDDVVIFCQDSQLVSCHSMFLAAGRIYNSVECQRYHTVPRFVCVGVSISRV